MNLSISFSRPRLRFILLQVITLFLLQGYSATLPEQDQPARKFAVIAYYHGNEADIDQYPVEKLTHIIYSFLHLKGNVLYDNPHDSVTLTRMVLLKKRNPELKVIVSLGGWGGCPTCPDVFATETGRLEFATSVRKILEKYHADGLDLDWEYPAIESVPGFKYSVDDRPNFTSLVQTLRKELGTMYELSFAAGAFTEFLQKSIEWKEVMDVLDYVNLMTYDYVNGYSKVTGHLTPLYNSGPQQESTANTLRYLDSISVPRNKMVIGAAFYARLFSEVDSINNGLFRPGKFSGYVNYYDFEKHLSPEQGYKTYYDADARASYAYNRSTGTFATFDDVASVAEKTRYAMKLGLGGIMFWSLRGDKPSDGLLEVIDGEVKKLR